MIKAVYPTGWFFDHKPPLIYSSIIRDFSSAVGLQYLINTFLAMLATFLPFSGWVGNAVCLSLASPFIIQPDAA